MCEICVSECAAGLASHPEHAVARKQMHCFSGMLSFVLLDTVHADLVKLFLKQLKVSLAALSPASKLTFYSFPLPTHE